MNSKNFINLCKAIVVKYNNSGLRSTDSNYIKENDVYVVWLTKVLQNNKALLSTNVPDGMYYELTYNGDKGEIYLDAYKKSENTAYKITEVDISPENQERLAKEFEKMRYIHAVQDEQTFELLDI